MMTNISRLPLIFFSTIYFITQGWAGDLGTAGPFRSMGGESCLTVPNPCIVSSIDPTNSPADQAKANVNKAVLFLNALRLDDAQDALDQAIASDPRNVDAYTLRGRLALTNGNTVQAGSDIDHALLLTPDDPDLLATWAYLHRDTEDLQQVLAPQAGQCGCAMDPGDGLDRPPAQ